MSLKDSQKSWLAILIGILGHQISRYLPEQGIVDKRLSATARSEKALSRVFGMLTVWSSDGGKGSIIYHIRRERTGWSVGLRILM